MSNPSSRSLKMEQSGSRHHKSAHSQHRPPSGGKKKLYREDSSSSLEFSLAEGAADKYGMCKGENNNNVKYTVRPDSATRRTPTPTKQISLQAVRRKKERQSDAESPRSIHRKATSTLSDSATRRTPTPTKQISLQAVRRKTDDDQDFDDLCWNGHDARSYDSVLVSSKPSNQHKTRPSTHPASMTTSKMADLSLRSSSPSLSSTSTDSIATHSTVSIATTECSQSLDREDAVGGKPENNILSQKSQTISSRDSSSDEYDTDLEDGEESSSDDTEEEKPKAPNELMMEFLACVMQKEYQNAQKLCKMILLYEPENTEALCFQPLIEEKLQMVEDGVGSSSDDSDDSDDSESGDDSDSEDDSDGDSDDDSDNSDDTSSTDEDETVTEKAVASKTVAEKTVVFKTVEDNTDKDDTNEDEEDTTKDTEEDTEDYESSTIPDSGQTSVSDIFGDSN